MSRFLAGTMLAVLATGCAHSRSAAGGGVATLAPEAKALTKLDGAKVSLDELVAQKDVTVLVFFASTCPCVKRYQDRVEALARQYPSERVQVFNVSSNADDDQPTLLRTSAERALTVPLLVDWSGALAQGLGVRSTPTTVVLDRQGAVQFRGWIDNERKPGDEGREAYVERAVAGLLSGSDAFAHASPMFGCTLTRNLGGAGRTAPSPALSEAKSCH